MLASIPVSMVNQKPAELGIPNRFKLNSSRFSLSAAALAAAVSTSAFAGPLPLFPFEPAPYQSPRVTAYAPAKTEAPAIEHQAPASTQSRFKRQVVSYATHEAPGTIVIDTPNTYLYLVLGNGQALRYGIGVGREGFTWAGTKTVEKKADRKSTRL